MFKNFRLLFIAVLGTIFLFSCVKKSSRQEVSENLKTAMGLYLNHQPGRDTALVKFNVVDVNFFEEKTYYVCEFQVNMKQKTETRMIDTVGTMKAIVSKDFKDVTRRN
jgi:hypothetical protein